MKRNVLAEMIWPEVAAKLANYKVGVVAVGSCEQHGPNSTFATDTSVAYEFTKKLSEVVGDKALIFPPVTYGISPHHLGFPGSATLRVETLTNVLIDIATSITYHGIKKVLFVNGHGGNTATLGNVVVQLKHEHGIDAYWTGAYIYGEAAALVKERYNLPVDPNNTGHACEIESSVALYLCPEIVSPNRVKGEPRLDGPYMQHALAGGGMAVDWRKHATANGALGDATLACAEAGKILVDGALAHVAKLIDVIIAM